MLYNAHSARQRVRIPVPNTQPRPDQPPLLGQYKLYEIRHKVFGIFYARAVEPHRGWCGFVIIDGNETLNAAEFSNGDYIELTGDSFVAIPL